MDLTAILQIAIGMIFVWVVLAMITLQIQEWISTVLEWRANMLKDTITQMLGNNRYLTEKVYYHPLIQGLMPNSGKRAPGVIPSDTFALVLIENVLNSAVVVGDVKSTFDKLKKNVAALKSTDGKHELKGFAVCLDTLIIGVEDRMDDSTYAIREIQRRVENWFNSAMERLGGAYRYRMQVLALVVGVVVAAILNADTVAIANSLWRGPILRATIEAQANQLNFPPGQGTSDVEDILQTLDSLDVLSIPIGWSQGNIPTNASGWAIKTFGILFSGMVAAQSAPYWFDLMRKLVSRG